MANRLGGAFTLAAMTLVLSSSAGAVDVAGTAVSLGWTPATGPVSGYYVIVSRNAAAAKVESVTIGTSKTLTGAIGETLVVQVAAFAQDGVAGPVSPASDPIKFVSSTGSGSGGGTTPPPPPPPDPDPVPGAPAVARDFTGDGTADLVVQTASDVRVWAMHGGSVSSEIPLPAAPSGSRVVGTGDYDGNGVADLLWESSQTSALTLWLLNGGAVATTGTLDRSSLPAAEEWHVGGSADFDGDGDDDLMLFSRVKGEIEVWTFTGAAVASRTRHAGHVGAWSVAAVDDTDGDGMAEIVWIDELARTLELRDPNASAPVSLGALGSGWRGRGAADFAGDGSAELVLNSSSGGVQAWALDDGGLLASSPLPSAQGLGGFAGDGDFDGDGREDVVWSDASDGAVTLWLTVATAPRAVVVNRALPAGGTVVSGATASDDGLFRQRFCSGDLNGNGAITAADYNRLLRCVDKPRTGGCALADMNSDGLITMEGDVPIFQLRFQGKACEPW